MPGSSYTIVQMLQPLKNQTSLQWLDQGYNLILNKIVNLLINNLPDCVLRSPQVIKEQPQKLSHSLEKSGFGAHAPNGLVHQLSTVSIPTANIVWEKNIRTLNNVLLLSKFCVRTALDRLLSAEDLQVSLSWYAIHPL